MELALTTIRQFKLYRSNLSSLIIKAPFRLITIKSVEKVEVISKVCRHLCWGHRRQVCPRLRAEAIVRHKSKVRLGRLKMMAKILKGIWSQLCLLLISNIHKLSNLCQKALLRGKTFKECARLLLHKLVKLLLLHLAPKLLQDQM